MRNITTADGFSHDGKRLLAKVPHDQWDTTTFLAALRCDRIDAPCLLNGPTDFTRETFSTSLSDDDFGSSSKTIGLGRVAAHHALAFEFSHSRRQAHHCLLANQDIALVVGRYIEAVCGGWRPPAFV